jgi:hypothetical protein
MSLKLKLKSSRINIKRHLLKSKCTKWIKLQIKIGENIIKMAKSKLKLVSKIS